MVVASVLRRWILHVSHLQADAGVQRRADAVIEPGIEDVLIAVGHVESPELLDVAQPRGHVRRGRGRHRSERNAVELGQWGGHEVAAATTAVLVRKPEGARRGIAVDVAEPNLVFPRLVAFAVLAAEILALEGGFQTVGPIDAVVGRHHRVQLAILVGRAADRHVPRARRQPQGLGGGVVTAGAVVAGVQRTHRIVAGGQVRRHEGPSRAIVQQTSPLPRQRIAGQVLGAVVGIEVADLAPHGQRSRGIQDDADVGERRVDTRIGRQPAQRGGRVPHIGRRHAVDGAARQRLDRPRNQVVVLLRTGERHDAGDPALEKLRELPGELPLQVVVVVARVQVELPLRKGRRRHARDRIRRDEQRVLERHRVDVVLEERRRGLQADVGQRVGELKPCQYVLRVVVDRFRDLDVAATAATAKDGAKGATAFPTLAGIAGEGFPVRRQREVEACPALLPSQLRGQRPARPRSPGACSPGSYSRRWCLPGEVLST